MTARQLAFAILDCIGSTEGIGAKVEGLILRTKSFVTIDLRQRLRIGSGERLVRKAWRFSMHNWMLLRLQHLSISIAGALCVE